MITWKLSAGTAGVIGRKTVKNQTPPTTAYIMLGENCRNACSFCTQAKGNQANNSYLSRITWPGYEAEVVRKDITGALEGQQFKRVCLQVVNSEDGWKRTVESLRLLTETNSKPICVSSHFDSIEQAKVLFKAGAERICLALDAATPPLYRHIKGGDWQERWSLLTQCAVDFPGSVTTHLIVGLGETEEEMVDRIALCVEKGITVGLFAFTPVRGTALEKKAPPGLGRYRRLQIAHYLLKLGFNRESIVCANGVITGYEAPDWRSLLKDGKAFETSGCPDCNRPYYNERPGAVPYNYPRPLTSEEIAAALEKSRIGGVG
ncbi:MAG: Radical domain protein [Firmicutes bacterium]|nr:Radical domain protein [Bacillota bacterium]